MKQFLFFILVLGILSACDSGNKFKVEGVIEGGGGEMVYLEHNGLSKSTLLDSTKINDKGEFRFRAKRPLYPDFYRLKLGSKQIHFAVDSTETIHVTAAFDNFSTEYVITGSESNTDIQILRKSVAGIQRKANQIIRGMNSSERDKLLNELYERIDAHKVIARPIILKNPRSAAAYFAIFQKVNDAYIFSPYVKEDRPYCGAVATSYHTYMPDYDRSKNLYKLVMDAIQADRQARQQQNWREIVDNAATGYIDIELPDRNGNKQKLSNLIGKVILLDFSAYESRESVQYTFALRELYNKFAAGGFEIYQVSLDRNKILWEDAVENLPWVCVRDANGPNTIHAATYNITGIPSYFLINREGDIIGRDMNLQALEREIQTQLKAKS
ncbi:MAG: thioredoxin-like domain-containing protein [Paludibacter sp.]|nr:thioredoxin-like domain-containing protein [Paludibacter sp.]